MQACIKIVAAPALGFTGTVTVTGVVDKNGDPFTPKMAMVHGNSTLNTLLSQSATPAGVVSLYWLQSTGWDDATTHRGYGGATGSRFGAKLTCTGVGPYSIMSEIPDVFFGGFVARQAYISAFRSGEFDITYDQNDYTGDSFAVILFGGADLSMAPVLANGTDTITVGWAPEGVIYTTKGQAGFSASGGSAVNAGIGWAAKTSGQGATTSTSTPTTVSRMQSITAAPYTQSTTAFTATGVTLSAAGYGDAAILIGGAGVRCRSGSFTSITGTGTQTVDLGISAEFVYLASAGTSHLSSTDTTKAENCIGAYDKTSQFSHWVAESATSNPPNGARYFSNAHILQFGTPATLASAITASASVTSLVGSTLTLNWSLNDGVAKEIVWFAIGPAAVASIIVNKQVTTPNTADPNITFTIDAGGGLSPTTLTLGDGDSHTYTGVLSGSGYSISETPPSGWIVSYDVSNGSPHDNISVVETDVTVTVTNAYVGPRSRLNKWGLYQFNVKIRKEQGA